MTSTLRFRVINLQQKHFNNFVNSLVATLQFPGTSTYQYADSQWHYAAVSVNQTSQTASLYLDGKLLSTQSIGGAEGYTHSNDALKRVGRNYGVTWNGFLDEMKVYNSALTPV